MVGIAAVLAGAGVGERSRLEVLSAVERLVERLQRAEQDKISASERLKGKNITCFLCNVTMLGHFLGIFHGFLDKPCPHILVLNKKKYYCFLCVKNVCPLKINVFIELG